MFKHKELPELQELQHRVKSITDDSKRVYVVDGCEKQYPSITTILGRKSKAAIMEWRQRVGAEEANRISRRAASKGTAVHNALEDFVMNRPVDITKMMPHHRISYEAAANHLVDNLGTIYASETPLYSDYLGVAGRVDLVAEYNGRLSIVDFKTSSKVKKREWITSYFLQETAYAIMFEERTGIPVPQLVTIMLVENETTPRIFVEKRDAWSRELLETIKEWS